MSNIPTTTWSTKEYVQNMSTSQKCKWLAFVNALQIIDRKAISLGKDPNSMDLPNIKIYQTYIEPESEVYEYHLNSGPKDEFHYFFSEV